MLRLRTFGGCSLDRDGVRLDAFSGQRKALALLAVLAAGDGAGRDTLLAHLWPERDEERARTSLRQLVHALRTQLAAPDLLLPSAELRLNPAVVVSDVAEFRAAVGAGDLAAAAALYAGPFLDGFHLRGADGFERWAAAERAVLAREAARVLERCAERAGAAGDVRSAVSWWRRLAAADPLSASAAVGLMRALDAAGERAGALQHARVYETLVREELGGAPDPTVVALADALRRAPPPADAPTALPSAATAPAPTARPPAAPAPTARPPAAPPPAAIPPSAPQGPPRAARPRRAAALLGAAALAAAAVVVLATLPASRRAAPATGAAPSVAVLPFANVTGDPADEPYSDGLTDELIGALGKVPGLRVTGRTSAFALKGRDLAVRAIADTLGVASVLEGSWRREGRRVRVSAQLVSAADGAVLWTETYDRELADVLVVQEEIARAIVGALRVRMTAGSGTRPRPPPVSPEARDLYLRGRHVLRLRTDREGTRQAAGFFEQAIARDPSYAAAHSGLSDAYTRQAVFGYEPPAATFARAGAAARRALALDPTRAEAHASLAHARLVSEFAWADAERGFRRAIDLDPGYVFARAPFAIGLASQGRYAEAIAQLDTARASDPLSPAVSNVLGRVYVSARRPDDAIRTLRQALELDPRLDLAHQQLGHAYLQKGMPDSALAAFRRAAELSGPRDSAQLAYAYAVTGRHAEAERIVRALHRPAPGGGALHYHLAMAFAGLGDADAAFRSLDAGFAARSSFMVGVRAEPAFERLHGDPRWAALLARMGLRP